MKQRILAGMLSLAVIAGIGACTNPEVPAGHEGYVYYKPLIFGQMEYRKSLPGPASTGVSWRLFVELIDMREQTYTENFELLSSDDLMVNFQANTRIRLQRGHAKDIVEVWGGSEWYERNVHEPLRTIVRQEVMKVSAAEIQLKTDAVSKAIEQELRTKYDGTPIEILSVDIGSFKFPPEVTSAINLKIAKQQELERQQYILSATKKDAEIRIRDALRVSEQQRIIGSTLDPLYVQRKAVQVYRQLANSANKTIIMLPNTSDATGMPMVKSQGVRKQMSREDALFIQEMKDKYMSTLKEDEGAAGDDADAAAAGEAATGAAAVDGAAGAAGAAGGTDAAGAAGSSGTVGAPAGGAKPPAKPPAKP